MNPLHFDCHKYEIDFDSYLYRALVAWPTNPGKALLRAQESKLLGDLEYSGLSLDFGCGDGMVASLLRSKISIGVDISYSMAKLSAGNGIYRNVVNADGTALPFSENLFSIIISNSTLEHIVELRQVLDEIHRVLKPGGLFAFTVPSPQKRDYLFYSQWQSYRDHKVRELYQKYFDVYWKHNQYFTPEEWIEALGETGFQNVLVEYYEPRAASTLIDLLRSVELEYKEWAEYPQKGKHVQEVWTQLLYQFLKPYYKMRDPSQGGGLFIRATKNG